MASFHSFIHSADNYHMSCVNHCSKGNSCLSQPPPMEFVNFQTASLPDQDSLLADPAESWNLGS